VRTHARERGAAEVAGRLAAWALQAAVPRRGTFELAGQRYELLRRLHGLTWTTERAVEVPVALRVLERHRGKRILEIGNVLSHYAAIAHEVVDKYEQAPGVRNVDLLDLPPEPAYDLVITVSTLEHVGRDEQGGDPIRAVHALERARQLVAPGGTFFATFPVGYNPELDRALPDSGLELHGMRRGPWREVEPAEAFQASYDFLVYSAEAVIFAGSDALL